jgi:peroxiredoxin
MTKKQMAVYALGVVLLSVTGAAAWQLGPALMPPKSINVGIAVGAKVPVAMPLLDSRARTTTLAQRMGPKGMVLILVRSADWCPFCKAQLTRSNAIRDSLAKQGYALASLSYDKPATLEGFASAKGLGYMMLSDQGSKMITALGLRDPQYASGSFAYGVPRPTILVMAPDGRVKAKYVSDDYRSRPSNDDVLTMIRAIKT